MLSRLRGSYSIGTQGFVELLAFDSFLYGASQGTSLGRCLCRTLDWSINDLRRPLVFEKQLHLSTVKKEKD